MKAVAVKPGIAGSARLVDFPNPVSGPQDVIVRMLQVGVCSTDAEINAGLYGQAPKGEDCLIIGHESVGQVQSVGSNINHLQVGDYVVATVRRPDDCFNCLRGEMDMCLKGNYTERGIKGQHGFMAQFYSEAPQHLVPIPKSLHHIAVLTEPLSIVEKTIYHAFKIQERMQWEPLRAVVFGAGPIGILASAILSSRGLDTYTVARQPTGTPRDQVLQRMNVTYMDINQDPMASLLAKLGNIDIIIEATGSSSVAFQAMSILGTNGVLCLTGVSAGDKKIEISSDALNLGLVLGNKTVFGTVNANRRDWLRAVQDLALFEHLWPGVMSAIITRRTSLDNFPEALTRQPDDIKVVIEI